MALILPGNVASATAATGFDVDNSCNFELGSLHKTVSSPSATFTISVWVKLSNSDVATSSAGQIYFWTGGGAGGASGAKWNDGNVGILDFYNEGTGHVNDGTGRYYRDPSAWYHWVWKNASGTGTLYVNGVQQGATFSMGTLIGSGGPDVINIGRYGAATDYAQMTLAEFVYLDNTAATPSSFGEFDEDSPTIWKPIDVSGLTFGTNGFHLDFSNASALGTDANGGTALTKTATLSQLTDTPTNNFATWNPLASGSEKPAFSVGNLTTTSDSTAYHGAFSTFQIPSSGLWYWEYKVVTGVDGDNTELYVGACLESIYAASSDPANLVSSGITIAASHGAGAYSANDIAGVLVNRDTATLVIYKNDSAVLTKTSLPTEPLFIIGPTYGSGTNMILNTGNPPYANSSSNTDPNGYGDFEFATKSGLALCTKNLGSDGG